MKLHTQKLRALAALLLLATSTPALRAADPAPAAVGGMILEDFNNLAGWKASAELPVFACAIQPIYEVAWNHYANRMGLGAKMPNVQELLNSQNVWWLERATPGKAYRPEEKRNTGMYGWSTLTHSNLGKAQKAAASTTK